MAKFKKNDLITDGHSTLWVTDVTDTDYEFTEQSFNKFTRPIEAIDANFRLWETKKIWHKGNEPADEGKEILFEWKSCGETYHDVGYYDKKLKVAHTIGAGCLALSPEDRWAYIEDLTQL